MAKPLLLLAFLVNAFFLVSSTGKVQSSAYSSSKSSSSSSASQSFSSSNVQISPVGPCSHGNQHASSTSVASSSSSSSTSSSSSSSSASVSSAGSSTHHPSDCKSCRENERWVACPAAVCEPKVCDDVGVPFRCFQLKPGGKCPTKSGCICNEGYARNDKGICIPIEHCPIKCTKENEVYDVCPAPCPYRTCGINDAAVSCAQALPNGHPDCAPPKCRCKDGFFRNDVGECVCWEDCPTCTNPNEIYDPCPAQCPPRRCDVNEALILCVVPPQLGDPECVPGCRCIDGFVKNQTEVCIPKEECPKCPNPNEVYDPCIAPCPPRRCDVDPRVIKCAAPPQLGDPSCESGCRCADGYVRDYVGVCIPREQCPTCTKPHEVYDPCPVSCPPQVCESLWKKYRCPYENTHQGRMDHVDGVDVISNCDGKCICEEGYYRNKIGECISKDDCLRCQGPHEYFSCGSACDNVCGLLDTQNQTNCPYVNIDCNPRCYCEKNYARNDDHICIPIKDCEEPQCGLYEEYVVCPANRCQPTDCSQVGVPFACAAVVYDEWNCPSKSQCLCIDGYVRDSRGDCIPMNECPTCAGDPNAVSGCGVYCNQRCRNVGKKPVFCTEQCNVNTCDCRKGYFLDENTGLCVHPKNCTLQCSANEVYTNCIQGNCSPQTCSQLGHPIVCPRIDPRYCKEGCLCQQGYVRNKKGICVPSTECPSCGGDPNAKAGCGGNCNRHCSDIGGEPKVCTLSCDLNGCDCIDGFYFDDITNKCVKPENCTPKCPANEWYSECTQGSCTPQNCSQIGLPIPCPDIKPEYCIKGCLCNQGYVRNRKGKCIPATKCRSCGGDPNKIFGCGIYCNKRCRDIGKKPNACITLCKANECDCREGYFLDENTGLCVLPEDCTLQCSANEVYSTCIQGNCSPQNCTQLGFPIPCPRINPKYCKVGCLCKPDYVRNDKGICVPSTDCPSCGGDPNAQAGCGSNCNRHCSNIGKLSGACAAVCRENGCDCKEGFFYDDNSGKCVKPEDCTPTCKQNEEYSNCTNANCNPQDCTQVGFPIPGCPQLEEPKQCKKGCQCISGYARNSDGVCIPVKECPSCGGDPNAEPGCGSNCNKHCSDVGKKSSVCALFCLLNGCDCKQGYYFDNNLKKCVKPEHCTPICLDVNNEVYSDCINGGCQPKNCSQYGQQVPCRKINPKYCIKGCLCKEGYLRAANGKCVLEKDCPEACTGQNEVFVECASPPCSPQTCDSLDKDYSCPAISDDEKNCQPMCRCKPGYYRNKIGNCISEEQCRRCMGPHEFFSCGGACDNVCETLGQQCPIVNIKCNEMCYCEDGYARAKNNTCIPESCCDEPQCPINEQYEQCPGKTCRPQKCTELGFPIRCPAFAKHPEGWCPTKPACVCVDGYVRNDEGICIPIKDCGSCGGDPNAESGCGLNCDRRCSNIGEGPVPCPRICKLNSCDCKDGYYYNEDTKKCVKPEQCPSKCLAANNEVYSDCINGGCTRRNCSQYGKPVPCIKINPKHCIKGCVCQEGYLRADNGKCIPEKDCPEACNGQNEEYNECSWDCPPQTCESLDRAYECPLQDGDNCKPMCRCKLGFFRNKIGQCISEEECRRCMGDHEYFSCGSACDNVCETLDEQSQDNCPIVNIKCNDMCYCEKGYARAKNNTCIPISCCNEPQCPLNEQYEQCPGKPCRPQKCSELGFPIRCPAFAKHPDGWCPTKPACVCVDGYVRNNKGKCIPIKDCGSCGGDPNAESGCGLNCDRRCSNIGEDPVPCPRICKLNSCDCRDGYYYNEDTKKCVKPEHCPPKCLAVNNEVYSDCINGGCQAKNCSQYGQEVPCVKIDPKYCIKGCLCKEGYLRAANGKCVLEENCPEACDGPNEEYNECSWNCPPDTCESLDRAYACPIREGDDCKPMCRCKSGYFRNLIGDCITEEQCRRCMGPHEYYSCGGACDNVCETLDEQSQDNCPIVNIKCNEMCYCEKGYARAKNNTCILISRCGDAPCCGKDEVYTPCVNGGCDMKNCSQLGGPQLCIDPIECLEGCICKKGYLRLNNGTCVPYDQCPPPKCNINERFELCPIKVCQPQSCNAIGFPIECPATDEECPGLPECICNYEYVRNDEGICVPVSECPSCGGDPNAQSGSGINCGKRCPNNNLNTKLCPRIHLPNACDCKKGFFYDINIKKCVKYEDCSPRCDDLNNEEYDPCVNGDCGWRNCSEVGGPKLCIDPIKCIKGCKCKEGYYKLKNGTCVAEDECPLNCWKPHEVYDPCPPICPPQTCNAIGHIYFCPKQNATGCKEACRCKPHYYRNDNGDCINGDDCPKCTGPNEYFSCGTACDNVCGKLDTESKDNCPIKNKKCVSKCYCKDGYARNKDNICVPICQCPGHGTTSTTTTTTTCKPVTVTPSPCVNITASIAKFERGNQALAGEFVYQLLTLRPGENFMISGFSVLIAMAQLALRATGQTYQQLMHVLNLDSRDEISTIFPILIAQYRSQSNVTFELGTNMLTNIEYPVTQDFVEETREVFDADVQTIDFSKNEEAAEIINDWVDEGTHGNIQNLVSSDMFSKDTVCVLVNYLYFLGNWDQQFNKNLTEPREFYKSNNETVLVDTMYRKGKYAYGESDDLDCQILKIDYSGHNFSLVIFLPKKTDGILGLAKELQDPDQYYNAMDSLSQETVEFYLPKLDISTEVSNMNALLESVGITEMLKPGSNGFEGILENDIPIYITKAVQKTTIKADESGTEAAAATAVKLATYSALQSQEKVIDANHPFSFYIMNMNLIVLSGCVLQ